MTPSSQPGKVLPFRPARSEAPSDAANRAAQGDAAARSQALDTRRSCIVEAPAGSGKTGLLVQRFLRLLADAETAAPEEVLALTFTNKATGELQQRVLEALHAAAEGPLPLEAQAFERETHAFATAVLERSRALGWDLLAQPQRLNIRTFDALSIALAQSQPLLSGAGGRRDPLLDATALYRSAARRTLMQLGRTGDAQQAALHAALEIVLLHRDANLGDCEKLLAQMLGSRDQWAELLPHNLIYDEAALDGEVRTRLERTLEAIVCAGLTHAMESMPAGVLEELTTLAARLGLEPGYKDGDSPIAVCGGRHEPPAAVAEHLDHWRALIFLLLAPSTGNWRASYARNHIRIEIAKSDGAYLKELVNTIQSDALRQALCDVLDLPPARYPDDQWRVAKALFLVLRHALAELQVLFAEREACDFIEFSLEARAALSADSPADDSAPDLALAAGGRLRHLLVDEMQDTSAAQYELIQLLTRSWDGSSQTLFLVGDPKQSIYLFRKALVGRFLRTMRQQRLGEIPLTALQLTANFRSQGALVAAFNDAFAQMFPSGGVSAVAGETVDVPFVAAEPTRDDATGPAITWQTSSTDKSEPIGEHRLREARALVDVIAAKLAAPKPPRMAVLGLNRSHLAGTVAELKRRAIPFRGIKLDPLDEVQEVLDVLALTRALLHPSDRIAWLAVLRGPWCGLSLADLLMLTGAETSEADNGATMPGLIASRGALLSGIGQQLLARAWPVLRTAAETIGRTPLSVHVERTWRSLGGDAALSPLEQSNVSAFFAVLREMEAEGPHLELKGIEGRLNKLFAEPLSGSEIYVDLLTIHGAKGLEWDIVLVPGLERSPRPNTPDLLNWLELDPSGEIVLAPIGSKGSTANAQPLNRWLAAVRTARDRGERKRLFYVAATRAREELHLFANLQRTAKGEQGKPLASTLLAACWPAAAAHFETSVPAATMLFDSSDEAVEAPLEPLALAAAGDETAPRMTAILQRLPLAFDARAAMHGTPSVVAYTPAASLAASPVFERPEGSFAVRAFGNVVHRYLQRLAERLAAGAAAAGLLGELAQWQPRLAASLRGEGLPPAVATREAARAQLALRQALTSPVGQWLLSPLASAASEATVFSPAGTLRVDRTFVAGADPMATGETHIWIVDYKTTAPGARDAQAFAVAEQARYRQQLETYAAMRRELPGGDLPIRLGLFYPLAPGLIFWTSGEADTVWSG